MRSRRAASRRRSSSSASGFTLLEVMVSLAILASTLVVLLQIVTNNVRATNHAKQTTVATLLARAKMIDIEDGIFENGFTQDTETASGTFRDQGYPDFRWESSIERIELPSDMKQLAQQQSTETSQSKDPMQALTGMVGGLMGSFMEPIRLGLEESVRRVTVKISWNEVGRHNLTLDVVTYLTDPAKLDAALNTNIGAMGAGTPGTAAPTGGTPR